MTSNPDIRRLLRAELRLRRRSLNATQQALAAQKLILRLGRHPWLNRAQRIGCYWPNDGEISPLPLMQTLRGRGKELYLPVLHPRQNRLSFRLYQPNDLLTLNRFGIPEPPICRQALTASQLDVLLMPLVGFDCRGNRLGMGGGFYDRTLSGLKPGATKLIGLAHRLQQVEELPIAHWDVPLAGIATDGGMIAITARR